MCYRLEHIAGNLFLREKSIRLVLVKAADHVIAVAPGVISKPIAFEAFALRKPDNIEPVPCPALSVVWRLEQTIDQPLPGVRISIANECFNVFRSRRQS